MIISDILSYPFLLRALIVGFLVSVSSSLLGVSLVTFLLMCASPLDPLQTNVGQTALGSMSPEQVEKLEDVLSVKVLEDGQSVRRELMLVKVRVLPDQRPGVTTIVDIFRGNIIDVSKDSMIIEVTGDKSKLEAFLDLLDGYDILETARTGITGLSRGSEGIFYPVPEEDE